MGPGSRVFVAGHRGLVGNAVVRRLRAGRYRHVLTVDRERVDLRCQAQAESWFEDNRPEFVILAAARVGGIAANSQQPASFISDNLAIQSTVIDTAYRFGVRRLLFLGSSCIYPRDCSQPILEGKLLSGPLEPTNEPYAVAKIAGIKLCEAYNRQHGTSYVSLMPTNLYGPWDNFDLENSHVLPALMRKLHEAKLSMAPEVSVWGSGKPRREFLYVADLADAVAHVLESTDETRLLNVGTGRDITIARLAEMMASWIGFSGQLVFDDRRPDGTLLKRLDCSRLSQLGWQAKTSLSAGISATYRWYQEHAMWQRARERERREPS
ncbi:MAG: GDP-L-fucose synthase [Deltaproteobacteria bacterium]|nr:GDP-L-fucose synthase [Deltaproteobacteria bacterium]